MNYELKNGLLEDECLESTSEGEVGKSEEERSNHGDCNHQQRIDGSLLSRRKGHMYQFCASVFEVIDETIHCGSN